MSQVKGSSNKSWRQHENIYWTLAVILATGGRHRACFHTSGSAATQQHRARYTSTQRQHRNGSQSWAKR